MKTDARIRYTRKVIRDSFVTLLREKPLNKITVKEICDEAEINRATFYKHYQDVYDLLEKLEDEALEQLGETLRTIEAEGVHKTLVSILTALRDTQLPYGTLAAQEMDERFIRRMMDQCFRYLEPHLNATLPGRADEQARTMLYAFYAGGCAGIMECWLRDGTRESPDHVAAQMDYMIRAIGTGLKITPMPQAK